MEDKILRKVKGLLDKANNTKNPHEKDIFFSKAEELMRKHTIELFMLEALEDGKGREPELRNISFPLVDYDYDFNDNLYSLFSTLASHIGVRPAPFTHQKDRLQRLCVGWPQDLDFLEVLFTSLYVDILANMSPVWREDLEEGENLHAFKSSGYTWKDIWLKRLKALGLEYMDHPWERKHGVRWTNVYKKWADANGIDRQDSSSLRYYRRDFGSGYVNEISTRLRELRNSRDEGEEVGLVLVDRKNALDEFFEERYPTPKPTEVTATKTKSVAKTRYRNLNGGAYRAGKAQGRRANIGQTSINQ